MKFDIKPSFKESLYGMPKLIRQLLKVLFNDLVDILVENHEGKVRMPRESLSLRNISDNVWYLQESIDLWKCFHDYKSNILQPNFRSTLIIRITFKTTFFCTSIILGEYELKMESFFEPLKVGYTILENKIEEINEFAQIHKFHDNKFMSLKKYTLKAPIIYSSTVVENNPINEVLLKKDISSDSFFAKFDLYHYRYITTDFTNFLNLSERMRRYHITWTPRIKRKSLPKMNYLFDFKTLEIGSNEYAMIEFEEPMSPERLIESIKAANKIDIPIAETSIQSLNFLLGNQNLYKVIENHPIEAVDTINKIEQGQRVFSWTINRLNRMLLEFNYPSESPKLINKLHAVYETGRFCNFYIEFHETLDFV